MFYHHVHLFSWQRAIFLFFIYGSRQAYIVFVLDVYYFTLMKTYIGLFDILNYRNH